jgi:hypothetical protein
MMSCGSIEEFGENEMEKYFKNEWGVDDERG